MAETELDRQTGAKGADPLIDPIYQRFVKGVIRSIGSIGFYEFFMDAVSRAQNEFQFSNRKLIKTVDVEWVDEIEQSLGAFQTIIASPRNVIKEEDLIVNVANARRAGSETVRHLATHSALVENYDPDAGEVRPSHLMQRYREESTELYENRLVFTALEYAAHFVQTRYNALFEAMSDEFGAKLRVNSEMDCATEHMHFDMFLHIKEIDSALKTDEKNREVFDRISRINRVLNIFMSSAFAQQMSKMPRVKGNATMTNVLKKNPSYKTIVRLWNFLRQYNDVGYAIRVVEQKPEISEQFQQDIFRNIMFNYLILKGYLEDARDREAPTRAKGRQRTLKPKIIRQIIEELTEDYDLPDVEVRKVLIEELTKADLMKEEAAERRRLVEEQEKKKKEEAARLAAEKQAEAQRLKEEREAERERLRLEKEAEAARKRQEELERKIEDRRRTKIFQAELDRFREGLEERLEKRRRLKEEQERKARISFEETVREAEEKKRREQETREQERRQKQEERRRLAEQQARQEEEERLRLQREKAEEEQRRQDMEHLKVYVDEYQYFDRQLSWRLELRARQNEIAQSIQDIREKLAQRQD